MTLFVKNGLRFSLVFFRRGAFIVDYIFLHISFYTRESVEILFISNYSTPLVVIYVYFFFTSFGGIYLEEFG